MIRRFAPPPPVAALEVETVLGKAGRADPPNDSAPLSRFETVTANALRLRRVSL